MTPDEWDTMAGTVFGGFEFAFDYVKETLAAWDAFYHYAVFSTYDLVPSETPEVPMDPQLQRLQELAREHPEGIGGWFTYDGEGTRQEFRPDESWIMPHDQCARAVAVRRNRRGHLRVRCV